MDTGDRSTFVSVVAWVFIVISGVGTLVATLQNVIIQILDGPMSLVFHAGLAPNTSWFMLLVLGHLKIYFAILLVLIVFTFVSSIGLLKRKNWARRAFIGLMIFGVIWNLPGLFASLTSPRMSVFFVIGLILIFGWIAKRMLSSSVIEEFTGER